MATHLRLPGTTRRKGATYCGRLNSNVTFSLSHVHANIATCKACLKRLAPPKETV